VRQQAISILKQNNQEHIIEILEKLSQENSDKLIKQILELDFKEINNLYNELKNGYKEELNTIEPVKYTEKTKIDNIIKNTYEEAGSKIIKENKLAVLTVAGGQGTRLGHKGPKGTYELDLEDVFGRKVSIFEVLSQNFISAKSVYNVDILWYIMTSNENKNETIKFFEKNNYFGLNKNSVKFFVQKDIPVIDENSKVVLGTDYLIKTASNGNGGIYEALNTKLIGLEIQNQTVLESLKNNGIEWIFVSGVDNILVNPIDPLFIGLTIKEDNLIAAKTVKKIYANEKTGVFAKKNGKIGVIEYNEISDELRNAVDENGELLYGQSNIISHLYSIKAMENLKDIKLRYHKAHKKVPYINNNLEEVIPEKENIYKFEKFIFDAFENFNDITILSVESEQEFAPIKNAEGKDSPKTAVELYKNMQH